MGDHHEKVQEQARQAAYIQIINNLATKLIEAFKQSPKDQIHFTLAFQFFSRVLNNKLVLIMDLGLRNQEGKPGIIFEKCLKLLATLGQLPTFIELMNTQLDSAEAKLKKYANRLYEILSHAGAE